LDATIFSRYLNTLEKQKTRTVNCGVARYTVVVEMMRLEVTSNARKTTRSDHRSAMLSKKQKIKTKNPAKLRTLHTKPHKELLFEKQKILIRESLLIYSQPRLASCSTLFIY
jgi:hypothetical protein